LRAYVICVWGILLEWRFFMKVLEIKRKDLSHNINVIKKEMECKIIAVVKGNGYGMGLIEYTKFLRDNGIDFFAVATIEEAVELRKSGIKEKILMLSSTAVEEEIKTLIDNKIILTVGSEKAAEVINSIAKDDVPVHIKIDTGFGRYGFIYDDIDTLVQTIKKNNKLKIEGCFSHFSYAFAEKNKWTILQYERFLDTIENLKLNNIEPGMLHICNSSAALKYPYMRLNAVRIGSAFTGRILVANTLGLKKIGEFKTDVVDVKMLPKGFNIGYSNTFRTKKQTNIAILPVGYMDGINMQNDRDCYRLIDYIRYFYNDFKSLFRKKVVQASINGKKYNAIGVIGLYNIILDIGNDNIKVGDIAILDVKTFFIDSRIIRTYI